MIFDSSVSNLLSDQFVFIHRDRILVSYIKNFRPSQSIFLLSVFILYLEVLLIRWVTTEVNIFAYLQNTILIICLLGLGTGCLKPSQKVNFLEVLIPLTILTCLLSIPMFQNLMHSISGLLSVAHDFVVWNQWGHVDGNAAVLTSSVIIGLFGTFCIAYLIWRMMVPLGKMLGALFEEPTRPILNYSMNIFGSLVGILIFAALGYFALSPTYWMIVLCFLGAPWILSDSSRRGVYLFLALLIIALPTFGDLTGRWLEVRWSPYQKLAIAPSQGAFEYQVEVNNSAYQQIQNNSDVYRIANPDIFPPETLRLSQYDIPSRFHPNPKTVLVVGTGTGNDIAGVLRNTKANIVAVEIDPVIIDFGKRYHPEHPYDSDRVTTVTTDARAYFQESKQKFDLVIFGLLDSHTTPAITNARLDHYVYTQEALLAASRLLEPQSVLVVLFQPQRDFIVDRIAKSLNLVFGSMPLVSILPSDTAGWGGTLFVTGDHSVIQSQLNAEPELKAFINNNTRAVTLDKIKDLSVTTDDWPYLYLENREIPVLFYALIPIFLILWMLAHKSYNIFSTLTSQGTESLHFISLGAAFALLEVYGINQAAIIFGNTWQVSCVIISGILSMILVANTIVYMIPKLPKVIPYLGIAAACSLLYFFPFHILIGENVAFQIFTVGLLCGLPVLFSGIVFARSFAKAPHRNISLSANLFGALIGGALQLLTFVFGIRSLLILVAGFYFLSFLFDPSRRRAYAKSASMSLST